MQHQVERHILELVHMPEDSCRTYSASDVTLCRSICPNPGETNCSRIAAVQGQFKDVWTPHSTCGPKLQSKRRGGMREWLRFEVQKHRACPWAGSQSRYHSGVKLTSQHSINSGEGKVDMGCGVGNNKKNTG